MRGEIETKQAAARVTSVRTDMTEIVNPSGANQGASLLSTNSMD